MSKKTGEMNGHYAILGVSRKNSKHLAKLAAEAAGEGGGWLRLELCGPGAWSAADLAALRGGLAGLGEALITGIMKKTPVYLLNFADLDEAEGCGIFTGRLLADAAGNYLLVPPQWRFDGRGLKLGHADKGIEKLNGCVYAAGSAACSACLEKRLGAMGYDAAATAEFDLGLRKVRESMKYLGRGKPAFRAYLDKVREEAERESGLLVNEKA